MNSTNKTMHVHFSFEEIYLRILKGAYFGTISMDLILSCFNNNKEISDVGINAG